MDEFEREIKLSFIEEASQLLQDAEESYLQLEADPNDGKIIDKIFRVAHNIKGSAKAVGFDNVGAFSHEFENLLLKIKTHEIVSNSELVSLLLKCNDFLKFMIDSLKENFDAQFDSAYLIEQIKEAQAGKLSARKNNETHIPTQEDFKSELETTESHSTDEKAAAASADLNSIEGLTIEEILAKAEAAEQNSTEASAHEETPLHDNTNKSEHKPTSSAATATVAKNSAPVDESIRVSLSRLEQLTNLVGEIIVLQAVLLEQAQTVNPVTRKTIMELNKVTKDVHYLSMGLRMVPVKTSFQKMQRIVRDTSKALNKTVNLIMSGEETEVDKTVLEVIGDPLVHLVRNACDHGIEATEKRIESGKSPTGTINLSAYHRSGKLVIEVKDDGGGINPEILKRKALEKGILKPNDEITDKQAINLIFHPGFSTKAAVTDVSGRGVGMDVVKTNIESIQGSIEIETEVGKGSTFQVVLPLTLSIIDALIVTSNNERFVIPLTHVQESVRITPDIVQTGTSLGEVLLLRGDNLPLYRLSKLIPHRKPTKKDEQIAIVIRSGHQSFGVLVEDILGQNQVVLKKLGDELQGLNGIAGCAVLGDGKPALILELADLISKNKTAKALDFGGAA